MKPLLAIILLCASAGLLAQQNTPTVFSLQDAVDFAYENSNSIRNARVNILDAEQNVREQLSTGLPQITSAIDYTRYLKVPVQPLPEAFAALNPDPNAPAPEGIAFLRKNSFTAGLNVSGMLFDGSFFVGLRAARASRDYFNLQLEDAERLVRNEVTQSYFPVLLTTTNLQLSLIHI